MTSYSTLIALLSALNPKDMPPNKKQVYFGDLHVHTHLSLDAGIQGTTTTPESAYAFAKGQPLKPFADSDLQLQLGRPLDFAAVTDHAELLGESEICKDPGLSGHYSVSCLLYRHWPSVGFIWMNMSLSRGPLFGSVPRLSMCGWGGKKCREAAKKPWANIVKAAENANMPGQFTAFIAYEWTGSPNSNNLHRNVIFKTGQEVESPVSYFEAHTPELLWKQLSLICQGSCQYLTIPHNSNLSGGQMFPEYNGSKDSVNAASRNKNEPLIEIFQHKGDAECGPTSPDESCSNFEKMPYNNLAAGRLGGILSGKPLSQDFVRSALLAGIEYQSKFNENPYQYGFVANTDTHLGAPGLVDEENFPGHGGNSGKVDQTGLGDDPRANPGGLTGIWALENTREALFNALLNKETFGTSGPRIQLRMYAGEAISESTCDSMHQMEKAFHETNPMGSIISDQTVKLAIHAKQDPRSAPLERIELIKGWVEKGSAHHRVIEVVHRNIGPNDICAFYQDAPPKNSNAFYYARVLEKPTKRWVERKCRVAKIDCSQIVPKAYEACCNPEIPHMIQERAWSSPIWRNPRLSNDD